MFSEHAIDSKTARTKVRAIFFYALYLQKNVHIYKIEETAVVVN